MEENINIKIHMKKNRKRKKKNLDKNTQDKRKINGRDDMNEENL